MRACDVNLQVQDKKRRQYVITALQDTKVDLKGASHEASNDTLLCSGSTFS